MSLGTNGRTRKRDGSTSILVLARVYAGWVDTRHEARAQQRFQERQLIHKDFQCEFYFIRHGESMSNARPGYAAGSDFDAPLSDRGFDECRLLGQRLAREHVQLDRVYSSTMIRAVQTTETMLESMGQSGRHFTRVEALIEQQMPAWRGVPADEVFTPETVAYIRGKGVDFVPPDGESRRMVQRRVSSWLEDEIIYDTSLADQEQPLTIAMVGHGIALRCLFQYIMGFDDRFVTRSALDNCSISRFVFNQEGWSVVCLNDSSHIDGADRAPDFSAGP